MTSKRGGGGGNTIGGRTIASSEETEEDDDDDDDDDSLGLMKRRFEEFKKKRRQKKAKEGSSSSSTTLSTETDFILSREFHAFEPQPLELVDFKIGDDDDTLGHSISRGRGRRKFQRENCSTTATQQRKQKQQQGDEWENMISTDLWEGMFDPQNSKLYPEENRKQNSMSIPRSSFNGEENEQGEEESSGFLDFIETQGLGDQNVNLGRDNRVLLQKQRKQRKKDNKQDEEFRKKKWALHYEIVSRKIDRILQNGPPLNEAKMQQRGVNSKERVMHRSKKKATAAGSTTTHAKAISSSQSWMETDKYKIFNNYGNKNYSNVERIFWSQEEPKPLRNLEYFVDNRHHKKMISPDDYDDDRNDIIVNNRRKKESSQDSTEEESARYERPTPALKERGYDGIDFLTTNAAGYDSNEYNSDTEGLVHSNNKYYTQSSVSEEGELSRLLSKSEFYNQGKPSRRGLNK